MASLAGSLTPQTSCDTVQTFSTRERTSCGTASGAGWVEESASGGGLVEASAPGAGPVEVLLSILG